MKRSALPTGRHWPAFTEQHVGSLLVGGYNYDTWNLRRFHPPKRYAVLVGFLQAALPETTDAVVEAQDKLITSVHSKAKKRRDELLRAGVMTSRLPSQP